MGLFTLLGGITDETTESDWASDGGAVGAHEEEEREDGLNGDLDEGEDTDFDELDDDEGDTPEDLDSEFSRGPDVFAYSCARAPAPR